MVDWADRQIIIERWHTLISQIQPLCQVCAADKINNPDTWSVRASVSHNVVQFDVPVEHILKWISMRALTSCWTMI